MSLKLHIDTAKWRSSQQAFFNSVPGVVPVAKGNGYGFSIEVLAGEAVRLGADTLAVGVADEVEKARSGGFEGDIVVLNPWRSFDETATQLLADPSVITTCSRLTDLAKIAERAPGARVIVEVLTSMVRHGLTLDEVPKVTGELGSLKFEGWTIHLPMNGKLAEAKELVNAAVTAHHGTVWLSHLSMKDYLKLSKSVHVPTRLRIGTKLWLGAPDVLRSTAEIIDLHPVSKGQRVGYWQRKVPADGWVAVVSGGTSHGVALAAPTSGKTAKQRLVAVATGASEAIGKVLSPFTIDGKKRNFVEPPHMQSSLVFIPDSVQVSIGDEVDVQVRHTTTSFDQVLFD